MLLYSLLLTVALVLMAPWWIYRLMTTDRDWLWQRLNSPPAALKEAVRDRRVIWLHAVSVGEVLAASRLVAELQAALGGLDAGWIVVMSTTTKTGQALAKERFGTERVFYMPLDFAWAVRAYLQVLKPAALVLMESELWPRMLHECERAGVPVAVVNARSSDRSFARGMKVRWIWGRVLRKVSLWLTQSAEDARRFVALGARAEAVKVGGNLKYDVRAPKVSRIAELIKEAAAGRPIIVAGSTVDSGNKSADENQLLIQAWWGELRKQRALLVLAPRHPEYFGLAYSVAMERPTLLATELLAGKCSEDGRSISMREGETREAEIIVLDTLGDLAAVYGVAEIAFVGGSLIQRGGHNPLEPAQFGVPVVMGPSFENFRDIVAKMQAANAICIVSDEDQLEGVMLGMLKDPEAARAMGERGRRVFEEQQGATARAVAEIVAMISRLQP